MSLIAWYPLNGDLKNYGLGDYELINDGAAINANGKIGSCYSFGSNASLQLHSDILLPSTNNWSISAWIYPTDGSGMNCIISNKDGGPVASGLGIHEYHLSYWHYNGAWEQPWSTAIINNNQWCHIAIVNYNNKMDYYINGIIDSTTNSELSAVDIRNPLNIIGCGWDGNFSFKGMLNDIRIYDHCLSPKEVAEIAKCKILHYPMNQIDGVVGGRNIALKTNQGTTGWSWPINGATATKTEVVEDNIRCCKFVRDGTAVTSWHYIFYSPTYVQPAKFKAGGTYTISFEVKSSINTTITYMRLQDGGSINMTNTTTFKKSTMVANQWSKIEAVLKLKDTLPTDISTCGLYIILDAGTGVSYTFRNLKITEGNEFTSWTPAPEDGNIALSNDNIIYDASGFGNHGTVVAASAPTWSSDAKVGSGSYDFNGTNQYIIGAPSSILPKDEVTASWWGYMDNWANYGRGISCTQNGGWNFEPQNGKMLFPIYSSGGYKIAISSKELSTLSSGWHMFTGTYDGMTVKIYIDGELDGSVNAYTTKTPITYTSNALFIGAEAADNTITPDPIYFNGKINDVRVYATALSEDAIKELYQTRYQVANNGSLFCNEIVEDAVNLIDDTNDALMNGTFTNGFSYVTMGLPQFSMVDNKFRVYRTPNYDGRTSSEGGNHNGWGGMSLKFIDKLQENHKYILMFHAEGQTSNGIVAWGFTNQMGWGGGGLTPYPTYHYSVTIPSNFQGEIECLCCFTVSDALYKTCTESYSGFVAGKTYPSYRDFACGWGYEQTGELGTDIYFSNFRLYDITGMDDTSVQMLANGNLTAFSISEEDGNFKIGDAYANANIIYEK